MSQEIPERKGGPGGYLDWFGTGSSTVIILILTVVKIWLYLVNKPEGTLLFWSRVEGGILLAYWVVYLVAVWRRRMRK